MSVVRPPITISGAMPSASALLGTAASAEIIQEVNAKIGSTFIGERYDEIDNAFMRNVVLPARQAAQQVRHTVAALGMADIFIPIDEMDQLKTLPPCMQLPMVLFAPVRRLLEQGRIDGFGYDPDYLPVENPYQRLVDNGVVNNINDLERDENNNIPIEIVQHWKSDDPDISIEDIYAIESMYDMVRRVLAETEYDPTNMDNVVA